MKFFSNKFAIVAIRFFFVATIFFAGIYARGENRNPGGNPGMDPVDPFTADQSPRALVFKKAWAEARNQYSLLDPPPEEISGEEQRQRVVDAYEKAIAMMPEAPPVPSMLIKIGQLWNSSAVASEIPEMALKAYERVVNEYPNSHKTMLQALSGLAYSCSLKKEYEKAIVWSEKILEYDLPSNAEPELVAFAERLKQETRQHLRSYNAAMLGFYLVDGEFASYEIDARKVIDEAIENFGREFEENTKADVRVDKPDQIAKADFETPKKEYSTKERKDFEPLAKTSNIADQNKDHPWRYISIGTIFALLVVGCILVLRLYFSRKIKTGGFSGTRVSN